MLVQVCDNCHNRMGPANLALTPSVHRCASCGAMTLWVFCAGPGERPGEFKARLDLWSRITAAEGQRWYGPDGKLHALLPAPVAASLWSLLAVCAALAGGLLARITLQSHAAAYVAAAAWLSGLVTVVKDAFMAGADAYWRPSSLAAGLATAAAVVCCITLAIRRSSTPLPWWSRLPRLVIAALAAGGLGAALVLAVVRQLGSPDTAPGEAAVAVARSLVLAVSALLLATIGSRAALPELTWLVYPLLAVGGLKLLLEDLPHGRPATLFLAFAAFGISLIMAPRLLRGRTVPPS